MAKKSAVAANVLETNEAANAEAAARLLSEEHAEEIEAEDEQEHRGNTVVSSKYKHKYADRAATMRKPKGVSTKALKRSTSDWLAIELMKRTLDEKAHIVVPRFEAILDANGVKHSHWNRTTPGWQGRLRMTGRLALQRVVAETGELVIPDEGAIAAPKTWVAKHQH